ncbi:MAG: LPXTG cell wall anchor domain-containing protein [Bacteroidetes bacterium]|nr:LPXTG cell wall anchor domain-containing protein [Bacteroidota bacterium]
MADSSTQTGASTSGQINAQGGVTQVNTADLIGDTGKDSPQELAQIKTLSGNIDNALTTYQGAIADYTKVKQTDFPAAQQKAANLHSNYDYAVSFIAYLKKNGIYGVKPNVKHAQYWSVVPPWGPTYQSDADFNKYDKLNSEVNDGNDISVADNLVSSLSQKIKTYEGDENTTGSVLFFQKQYNDAITALKSYIPTTTAGMAQHAADVKAQTAITSSTAQIATANSTTATQNAAVSSNQADAAKEVAKTSSNTTLYIVGGVVLVAVIIGFFFFKSKNK